MKTFYSEPVPAAVRKRRGRAAHRSKRICARMTIQERFTSAHYVGITTTQLTTDAEANDSRKDSSVSFHRDEADQI